ncbi:probable rhamnogalacturonate lyase B [Chenopodium quinoa]|uniref:Rhamnogalacturonan endolyase n=1 Tax=Chenopodium quinoa TaxID=63459 RepID=A0A803LV70_CHEQI|nr:probable rhamnogalacturonate lyase B [Chenopodium quinoa]
MDSASVELPRPPAHGKYDFHTNRPRQRKGAYIKCFCIALIVIILIALCINAIVLFVAFKKAHVPNFQVKNVQVSKFSVANVLTDQQKVLSTDLDFFFESDNKNPLVGVDFGNMVMDTSWDGVQAHLGETHVQNFVQKSKGVSKLKVSTKNEVELKKNVKPEDMKLKLSLSGDLKFFSGPFKTKLYPFMISCNDISSVSVNAACTSKMYNNGKKPEAPLKPKSPTPPQTPKVMPNDASPTAEGPTAEGPAAEEPADEPPSSPPAKSFPPVKLTVQDKYVIMDNGFLQATIAKPGGFVTGIKYNGVDNILDTVNPEDDRGYWDVVWAPPGTKGTKGNFQRIIGTDFRVILEKEEQLELSFKISYDPATGGKKVAPMEIDQRYVMLRGVSGIYAYGIFERAAWPAFGMPNARLAFKLQRQQFKYMVIADNRQREMPAPEDRMKNRAEELIYPEAVILKNPTDPQFKGEVDDKYQYSMESQDIRVHGWISKDPPTGFWQITPSYEFRSGGPNKQFLTSHVGPSTLAMFVSAHYSGEDLIPRFAEGEPWNHIYGPMFMYMNNVTTGQDLPLLWDDAKERMLSEVKQWPYSFPTSEDFPKANERVNVTGRFFVHDRYLSKEKGPARNAFIGLGPPGEAGSWQRDSKTYQFWTRTDQHGNFTISFVRVGSYNLHGWVDGFIGDFKHNVPINITVGQNVDVGEVVFEPPRDGPTLWEIGVPDRLAREFFIPDPNPKYVNKLYVNHPDRFRQYGLWERYAELYPKDDLVYDVNASDYSKDWFYAQVTRPLGGRYNGTTWSVKFNLDDVALDATYKLRLAIASATNSDLQIRFNKPKPSPPIFTTGKIGNDNSIARHGIHGLYWLYNVDVKGSELNKGSNTLFLTQSKGVSPFQGIMYDYLRLEGPPTSPK